VEEPQNGKKYFQGNGTFVPLKGEELVNARLKAVTKAKRRVTLSICGLAFLDESEVETVKQARRVNVDPTTGEIVDDGLVERPLELVAPGGVARIEELAPQAGMDAQEIAEKMGVSSLSDLTDEAARKVIVRLRKIIAEKETSAREQDAGAASVEQVQATAEDKETEKLKADYVAQVDRLGLHGSDERAEVLGHLLGFVIPEWDGEDAPTNLQRKRVIAQLRKLKSFEDAQEWVGVKQDEARLAAEAGAAALAAQEAEASGEPKVKVFPEAEMQWATGDFGGESERKAKPADRIFNEGDEEPAGDIPF
jgi:hypothetical protein